MRTIERSTPMSAVLAHADAADVVRSIAPEVLDSPMVVAVGRLPVGRHTRPHPRRRRPSRRADHGGASPTSRISALGRRSNRRSSPAADYESTAVPRGSARVDASTGAAVNRRTEIVLHGPSHGNPFVDVDLTVSFRTRDTTSRSEASTTATARTGLDSSRRPPVDGPTRPPPTPAPSTASSGTISVSRGDARGRFGPSRAGASLRGRHAVRAGGHDRLRLDPPG